MSGSATLSLLAFPRGGRQPEFHMGKSHRDNTVVKSCLFFLVKKKKFVGVFLRILGLLPSLQDPFTFTLFQLVIQIIIYIRKDEHLHNGSSS